MKELSLEIIVGCYRQEQWLAQAVASAENQIVPYRGTELLSDFKVRVVHDNCTLREGSGIAAARNRAIAQSSADWIYWLDADDLMPSHFVYEMCKALLGCNSPYDVSYAAAQFYCGCRLDRFRSVVLSDCGNLTEVANASGFDTSMYELPAGMTGMFSKKLWERIGGFDEQLSRLVDLDFWVRARKVGLFVQADTFLFRRNVKGFTYGYDPVEDAKEKLKADASMLRFEDQHGIRIRHPYVPYIIPSIVNGV